MSKHERLTRDTHRKIDKQRVGLVLSNQYHLSLETANVHFVDMELTMEISFLPPRISVRKFKQIRCYL